MLTSYCIRPYLLSVIASKRFFIVSYKDQGPNVFDSTEKIQVQVKPFNKSIIKVLKTISSN
jgi:hypothetical protein